MSIHDLEEKMIMAEIIYYPKDQPIFSDLYVWQDMDCVVHLPRLSEFLVCWSQMHQHKIKSITVFKGDEKIDHHLLALV
ncbi:MAG: hypothetical protein CNLJKLNK_00547 [Holosporales bacterium]